MGNLSILRAAIPTAQVSSYTTGSMTLPSARGAFTIPGDWDHIASVSPTSSGQAEITISSIPQTYKHLYATWTIVGVSNGDIGFTINGNLLNGVNQFFTQGAVGGFYNSNVYAGYVNYAINVSSDYPHWGYGMMVDYTSSAGKNLLSWNSVINASSSETDHVMNYNSSATAAITSVGLYVTGGGMATSTKLNLYGISN